MRNLKILLLIAGFFAATIGLQAQTQLPTSQLYTWPVAPTGTAGQLGNYLLLTGINAPRPSIHTIDVTVTGTTPATCTFRVEGSSDGSAWYGLDVTSPATNSCTSNFMESIAFKPVAYIRINLTYTQGDTTTSVIFHYTGGRP